MSHRPHLTQRDGAAILEQIMSNLAESYIVGGGGGARAPGSEAGGWLALGAMERYMVSGISSALWQRRVAC